MRKWTADTTTAWKGPACTHRLCFLLLENNWERKEKVVSFIFFFFLYLFYWKSKKKKKKNFQRSETFGSVAKTNQKSRRRAIISSSPFFFSFTSQKPSSVRVWKRVKNLLPTCRINTWTFTDDAADAPLFPAIPPLQKKNYNNTDEIYFVFKKKRYDSYDLQRASIIRVDA